jgi:hypothetical protein
MRLEVTLARLAAVVGSAERVGAPELLDSHRRDAFRIRHFAAPEESRTRTAVAPARIGLRVLRPAEAIYVQTYKERPHQFVFRSEQYMVVECYGPWHSSGDWWGPEHWACTQWDVVASSRVRKPLCCQLSCDPSQSWRVEALYD